MTDDRSVQDELEGFFAAARAKRVVPDAGLEARVLAMAVAEQPAAPPRLPAAGGTGPGRFWPDLAQLLGGWRGLGGMTAAMVLGLTVGMAGAIEVPLTIGADVLDLTPVADSLFADAGGGN